MMKCLLDFVRIEICLAVVFLAISGYLLFNTAEFDIIFVSLASFLLCCGAYGHNTITDKEEDTINRYLNPFSFSKKGHYIVAFSFSSGFIFSVVLGHIPAFISAIIILSSICYSHFRLKRYILMKNIYTGFALSLAFVLGTKELSFSVLTYYFAISLFFFVGSIISDMRDCSGDKKSGIKTVPVRFGLNKTKKAVSLLLALILLLFLKIGTDTLTPFIVLVPLILLNVLKNEFKRAHKLGAFSIFIFLIWIIATKI